MSATFTPPTIASETIAHIGSFELRNTLLVAWIVMAILIIGAFAARKTGYKIIPKGFQNFVEFCIEGLFNFFNSVTQDEKQTRQFFPIVATIFIFIMTANWLGIFPGFGTIGIYEMHEGEETLIPIFRSMNADINMTLAIAVISVVATQVFGIAALGFFKYAGKFFVPPWKDPIGTFVGILELISEIAKMVSFSFRLFGNIFAGEVLLTVIGFLAPYIMPMPFLGLELFVGFIQALVFSLLTLVFLKMAVTSHHEEHVAAH